MRRGRQRLDEVHERTSPFGLSQSCHPGVAAFAAEEPALSLSKGSLHLAGSIGASGWCTGPSSGKERAPQDDNALEDDMWFEDDELVKWLANSFVRNILRVSPYGSRFCGELKLPGKRKSFEMNILPGTLENIRIRTSECKSLFWNILRVKSLESRFCRDRNRSREYKLFEINILAEVILENALVETLLATSLPMEAGHLVARGT